MNNGGYDDQLPGCGGSGPDRSDAALRDRIAGGDVHALGIAFDRYGALIYREAVRRCSRGWVHAEYLTRATFLHLWTRPGQRPRWPLLPALLAGLLEQVRSDT